MDIAGRSESSINTSMLTLSTPGGGRAACDSDLVNSQAGTTEVSSAASYQSGGVLSGAGMAAAGNNDALGTMQFLNHYDICLYSLG